ncbi:MAG: copper chaperone PCu(A)C [Caulobacteraceae bacterium]
MLLPAAVPRAALALLLLAGSSAAAPRSPRVADGWTRPAAAGVNGAGYLTIVNAGGSADTLVAAASPSARRVSIHQSRMTEGVMSMRSVPRLAIPAGGTIALAPGGYHLMLEGLVRPLRVGDRVPVALTFAKAGPQAATLLVRLAPPSPMPGMKM